VTNLTANKVLLSPAHVKTTGKKLKENIRRTVNAFFISTVEKFMFWK